MFQCGQRLRFLCKCWYAITCLFLWNFFEAPSFTGRVYPSVRHDGGRFRPAGLVEEERAEETGPTVLTLFRHVLKAANSRTRDLAALLHCHAREPVPDLLTTKFWPHLMTNGRSQRRTDELVHGCQSSCLLDWSVSNRDCHAVVLCFFSSFLSPNDGGGCACAPMWTQDKRLWPELQY